MKPIITILALLLLSALLMAGQDNLPRVFVQRLVLEDGSDPAVTVEENLSAAEYNFQAWIKERPEEVMDTDKNSIHYLRISRVGNGETVPYMVVCQLNLGNFNGLWKEGETLHLKVTHKATKQVKEWEYLIPEGTALIKLLDEPAVIPPYTEKETKSPDCGSCGGCF